MKTVANFREPYKAYLTRDLLTAAAIPAVITNEHLVGIDWLYSQAIGGVKVKVPDEFFSQALDTLQAFDQAGAGGHQAEDMLDRCPACGSPETFAERYSLWAIIPLLLFFHPGRRKKWGCRKCPARW